MPTSKSGFLKKPRLGFTPPPTPALKYPPLSVFFVFENHCFESILGCLGALLERCWERFFIDFCGSYFSYNSICGFEKPSWVAKTSQNTSRCLKNQPPKGCMGRPGGPGGPLGWPWPPWGRFGPWGSAGGPPICRLLAPSWRPLGAVLAFKIDSGRSKNRFQF